MLNEQRCAAKLREAPFVLESGESLSHVEIAYHTYGTLNADRSNAIVLCHAILSRPSLKEWVNGLVGDGCLLDTDKYFVISANLLGGCFGTTGPESVNPETGEPYLGSFPEITIRDIARASLGLLDVLDISVAALAIGGSMGGMIVLEMAALAPHRFRAIAPLAVGGAQTAWSIAFCGIGLQTIRSFDPTLQDRTRLQLGLAVAAQCALVICRSPTELEKRFGLHRKGSEFMVDSYLAQFGNSVAESFSPYSYLTLTRALQCYDLARGRESIETTARTITIPALFVGCATDMLYDPHMIERFARLFPQGEYHTLHADHGHDSFLVDRAGLAAILVPFIRRLEYNKNGGAS